MATEIIASTNHIVSPVNAPRTPISAVRSALDTVRRKHRHRSTRRKENSARKARHRRYNDSTASKIHRISKKVKRGFPGSIPFALFKDLQQTWPHFLEMYSKCDKNLSDIDRPPCAPPHGFMAAPDAFNEPKRAAVAKQYMHRRMWRDSEQFDSIVRPLKNEFNVSAVSISLITKESQVVKYQIGPHADQIARNVSIDAHALLSTGLFALCDCSQDWRLGYNPFVHGPPFTRFYAAVQLVSKDGLPIGVLSIFDPYARREVPAGLDTKMTRAAAEIMALLDSHPSILSPRIESAYTGDMGANAGATTTALLLRRGDTISSPCLTTNKQERFPGLLPMNCCVKYDMNSLKKLNKSTTITQSFQIARELSQCLSSRGAANLASKILGDTLGLEFVYVVEVRISKTFLVNRALLPLATSENDDAVVDVSMLGSELERSVHTRLLGGIGVAEDEQFDPDVHVHALMSPYGIQYDAPDEKLSFRSGIFMPFRRSESQVVAVHSLEQAIGQRDPFEPVANTLHRPQNHQLQEQQSLSCYETPPLEGESQKSAVNENGNIESNNVAKTRGGSEPRSCSQCSGICQCGDDENSGSVFIEKPNFPGGDTEIFRKFAKFSIRDPFDLICGKQAGGEDIQDELRVKVRHGGYVMAGFGVDHRSFSPNDVEYMKNCVRALEIMFTEE